ncbi:MAG TPA: hypothetical protein VL651_12080 [Bacteroidia bacterium]|nr:hypothetical protein [Bacteroidia bacterium]
MKRAILLPVIFFTCSSFHVCFNGDYPWDQWNSADLAAANTAKNFKGMSDEEKNFFLYLNLARLQPRLFAQTYLQWFTDSISKPTGFTHDLKAKLMNMKPVGVLIPDSAMNAMCAHRAYSCAKYGWMDLADWTVRGDSVKDRFPVFSEIFEYGSEDGFGLTLGLLIGQYNTNFAECRRILLDKNWTHLGVAFRSYIKDEQDQGPVGIIEFGQIKSD